MAACNRPLNDEISCWKTLDTSRLVEDNKGGNLQGRLQEIAATLEGTAYVTRQSVQSVAAIRKAKKAIRKAFECSMQKKGSSLVEIVSTCNSGWKMTPEAANKWMEEHMFPFYPLGDLKDTTENK